MSAPTEIDRLAGRVGELALAGSLTVAAAESLTGGAMTSALARVHDASDWLRGGVVAYASEVKFEVLNVRRGPVICEAAALDMARGVALITGANLGLAVTGAGGPEPQEDQPPGTVWIGVELAGSAVAELHRFEGSPAEIVEATCVAALRLAIDRLEHHRDR